MIGNTIASILPMMVPAWLLVVLCTWISALVGAALAYIFLGPPGPRSVGGYLRFCFPAAILRHPSCRTDVLNYGLRRLLDPLLIWPLMLTSAVSAAAAYATLTHLFGPRPEYPPPIWLGCTLLLIGVLLQDFLTFYTHYLMHKLAPLWELHKAHHGATFLLPITNQRFHPLQALIDYTTATVPVAAFLGVAIYVFAMPIGGNWIIARSPYLLLNILSFYHLRHSHIYLTYGWLERYVLSPAQHQLHHSQEVEHWDCNFGLLLSCWDRMFGTLIYARQGDRFRLGLPESEGSYDHVRGVFITPIARLANMAAPKPVVKNKILQ